MNESRFIGMSLSAGRLTGRDNYVTLSLAKSLMNNFLRGLGLKKGDFLVLGIIFVLEGFLAYFFVFSHNSNAATAVIKNGSVIIQTVELNSDDRTFFVDGANGPVELELSDGRIRFVHADCPDQVCVNTGWISHPGRAAACIPNGILIEIDGKTEDDVDVILT